MIETLSSIKLKIANIDTCLLANIYQFICSDLLANSGSELDNSQQMDAYELTYVG